MLTQSQAKEWGKDGIRVNAICPGLIKTKFSAALWTNEKMLNKLEKSIPSRDPWYLAIYCNITTEIEREQTNPTFLYVSSFLEFNVILRKTKT